VEPQLERPYLVKGWLDRIRDQRGHVELDLG